MISNMVKMNATVSYRLQCFDAIDLSMPNLWLKIVSEYGYFIMHLAEIT